MKIHDLILLLERAEEAERLLQEIYYAIGPYQIRELLHKNDPYNTLPKRLEQFHKFDDSE